MNIKCCSHVFMTQLLQCSNSQRLLLSPLVRCRWMTSSVCERGRLWSLSQARPAETTLSALGDCKPRWPLILGVQVPTVPSGQHASLLWSFNEVNVWRHRAVCYEMKQFFINPPLQAVLLEVLSCSVHVVFLRDFKRIWTLSRNGSVLVNVCAYMCVCVCCQT